MDPGRHLHHRRPVGSRGRGDPSTSPPLIRAYCWWRRTGSCSRSSLPSTCSPASSPLFLVGLAKPLMAFYIGSLMLIIVTVSVACFFVIATSPLMTERKEEDPGLRDEPAGVAAGLPPWPSWRATCSPSPCPSPLVIAGGTLATVWFTPLPARGCSSLLAADPTKLHPARRLQHTR